MRLRRNLGALLSLAVMGLATYACNGEARRFDTPEESGGAAGESNGDPTGRGGSAAGTAGKGAGGTAGATAECSDEGPECVPGEATARVCDDGAWKEIACEGETPLCSKGRCVSCEPGAEECRNDVAHQCDEDGSWESLNACEGRTIECQDCTLGQECSDESGCGNGYCLEHECVECEPGTGDCVGVTPRLCSNNGTWVNQPSCGGELPLCDADTGACVCDEGEHSCADGETERRCVDGAWEDVECRFGCLVDKCRTDTVATPGLVQCDPGSDTTCDVSDGNVCCLAQEYVPEHTCTTKANCPDPMGGSVGRTTRHRCDNADDCPQGQACCFVAYYYMETHCSTSADSCHYTGGPQSRLVCDPNGAACPNGRVCKPRSFEWASESVDVGLHTCEDP